MTFKASLRELSNGFLVNLNPKVLEYEEVEYEELYAPTFEEAIAAIVASYKQWYPSASPSTPPRVPVTIVHSVRIPGKASKKPLLKEPSEGAKKFAKICGLIEKPLKDFEPQFETSFPGEDMEGAIEQGGCEIFEGKIVFTGVRRT
ncbi:MAG: hypothetical protein ABSA81_03665 [Candidatus Bathyarchaeia archaeon]|jgi:hypothetical protein